MDITANKQDKIYRPDSVYTLNAGEMNQIISEIMTAITSAGIAPSSADTGQLREAILARISAHNTDGESHADIRQALETLQLLKLVDVLPAQGESKYIYAVPQDERTTDGQLIVVLFIWTGTEWAAVGALTTSVDLSEYLKKTEASSTYTPLEGGNMGKPLSAYNYVNNTTYYYWNKLFNISNIKVNDWAIFLIAAKNDYNSVVSFSHLLYVSRYNSAGSYSVLLSPLVSFNTTAGGNTKIYVAADGDNNIYVQARATWVGPGAFKIIKIVGDVNFTPEKAGYALLGEDPENFTSLAKIEDSGAFKVSLADNNVLNYPASYNVLKLTSQYAISDKNGNNIDTTYIKNATKGVSGGVASLGMDGKVPQEQLPNISAATPVTGLGQVTSASFEVNKNYAASVSGTAAFTLPTPTDTTIANKITLSLNVLANSVINWGANANAALAEFTPGKYQIRLLWNNTSSAWSAEVLKETEASSPVKLLIRFNGSISDESASPLTLTPSRTVTAFPVYAEGQYGQQKLTCTGDSADNYVTASGNNLPKLNLGIGDFTIRCWLTLSSYYAYPVRIFYKNDSNQIALGYDRIHIRIGGDLLLNQGFSGVNAGDTAYITLTRQNGVLYFFVNGTLVTSQASAEAWNLSDWTQIFKGYGVTGAGHYGIQELIVKNTCDYVADFTVPSAPFVLADSGVSDLHDIKMAELYSSISALQNELQILKGQSMKRLDYTNAVQFYLKEKDQTFYTVPANGYIFGYGYQTYQTVGESYTGNILINGINVGIYFRRYTLSNDQVDTSIPLSMPLPVSAGDVITITGNREAFQEPYLFVPEKED